MPAISQRVQINTAPDVDYREENMVRMSVICRPLNQPLPNGNVASAGAEKDILVYESQEKAVLGLLETNLDGIKQATAHYDRELVEYLSQSVKDNDVANATPEDRERAAATYPGSIPASYNILFNRDILPLSKAETVERDIPPPQQKKAVQANDAMLEKLIPALATIFADRDERMLTKVAEIAATAGANAAQTVVDDVTGPPSKKR